MPSFVSLVKVAISSVFRMSIRVERRTFSD